MATAWHPALSMPMMKRGQPEVPTQLQRPLRLHSIGPTYMLTSKQAAHGLPSSTSSSMWHGSTTRTSWNLADDEPEQARASTEAWDAAFLAFHTARVQRDSHWRKHIHLETDLLSATHASDMLLVSRGLTTSAGSLRAGIWTLSEAERNMMSH